MRCYGYGFRHHVRLANDRVLVYPKHLGVTFAPNRKCQLAAVANINRR
jgi:hypothetical protein